VNLCVPSLHLGDDVNLCGSGHSLLDGQEVNLTGRPTGSKGGDSGSVLVLERRLARFFVVWRSLIRDNCDRWKELAAPAGPAAARRTTAATQDQTHRSSVPPEELR
jgi:hypothetical protein